MDKEPDTKRGYIIYPRAESSWMSRLERLIERISRRYHKFKSRHK